MRHANLAMMVFWLFIAVMMLGSLLPAVLNARIGESRRVLGGLLAVGLAVYNLARWWSGRPAGRAVPQVNPLAVRKIEPGDADYNLTLDFNRPVVVEEKPEARP